MANDLTPANAGGVQIAPAASRDQIMVMDNTLKAARSEIALADQQGNQILKALTLAKATQQLRNLLTPALMEDVMMLQNTPLGFRTDRDPGRDPSAKPYPVAIVRDVAITAMIDGARMVGNEFNIIAGNYYRTLEQFERRIREYSALTDFRLQIGVPVVDDSRGWALADMRATWKLAGKQGTLICAKTEDNDTRIPIRVNKGMGLDAILGKARRKFLARVLDLLDGTSFEVEDAAIEGTVVTAPILTQDTPAEYAAQCTAKAEPAAPAEDKQESAETAGQRVADFLAHVDATLTTCDLVTDVAKAGKAFLDRIIADEEAGLYTEGEADSLRKIIAGAVEARSSELRGSRGEKSNRK